MTSRDRGHGVDLLRSARSFLFVPGNRADRFDKAVAAHPDVVVLDLEDAVLPADKTAARSAIAGWLCGTGRAIVRINDVSSEFFAPDCAELSQPPGLLGVMLPKADGNAIAAVHDGPLAGVPLVPLVETALGLAGVELVAGASDVARVALGTIDLALDLGMEETWDSLLLARSTLVLASRVAGLAPPVDGVTARLDDLTVTTADARAARALGFGAKLCIHPSQVMPVSSAFSPTDAELAWARAVTAAPVEGGAARHAGSMIDEPVRERARRLLAAGPAGPQSMGDRADAPGDASEDR